MQRGHIYLDIHIDRQICIYPYACDAENTNTEHAHTPEKRDTGEYRYAHMRMNLDIHMNVANAEHAHSPEKRGTGEWPRKSRVARAKRRKHVLLLCHI